MASGASRNVRFQNDTEVQYFRTSPLENLSSRKHGKGHHRPQEMPSRLPRRLPGQGLPEPDLQGPGAVARLFG
ncbi:unnamed protein product [Urochloa humidicola]